MWAGIELLTENLGFSYGMIITLLWAAGLPILFVRSFRLGLVLGLIGSFSWFMYLYYAGYNWSQMLIIAFIFLAVMSLSLYMSNRIETVKGVV